MTLSPARAALAAHQRKLADARAACDEVRRPLLEVRDRLDRARADLREAESDLARAQAAETEAIISGSDGKRQGDGVVKATASADRCRRIVTALEAKAADLEAQVREAEAPAGVISASMQPLIDDVIANDVADALLSGFLDRLKAAAQAEASYRGLMFACQRSQRFKLLERLSDKLNRLPAPYWGDVKDAPDWTAFIGRLTSNAETPLPEAP